MNNIPSKLGVSPLLTSGINVKFERNDSLYAIFGVIYQHIKEIGSFVSRDLPISQIPLDIREQDPILKFAPQFMLISNDKKYNIQIGHRVLSIVYDKAYGYEYEGWDSYFKSEIESVLKFVQKLQIINNLVAVEYRNVNFFEKENIFDNINISVCYSDASQPIKSNLLVFQEQDKDFANQATLNNNGNAFIDNAWHNGSMLEILTSLQVKDFLQIIDNIDLIHTINKNLFFKILKKGYVDGQFKPEY